MSDVTGAAALSINPIAMMPCWMAMMIVLLFHIGTETVNGQWLTPQFSQVAYSERGKRSSTFLRISRAWQRQRKVQARAGSPYLLVFHTVRDKNGKVRLRPRTWSPSQYLVRVGRALRYQV